MKCRRIKKSGRELIFKTVFKSFLTVKIIRLHKLIRPITLSRSKKPIKQKIFCFKSVETIKPNYCINLQKQYQTAPNYQTVENYPTENELSKCKSLSNRIE